MRQASGMSPVSQALVRRAERRPEPAFERLLAAARARFAGDGYAATSLDAVAADAGVTKGSLYHHFAGKAELFEAVFEQESSALCDEVARVVAGREDPWQAAYAGVAAFLDAAQDPAVQRIMLLDAPSVLGWERVREIEAHYGLALVRAAVERLVGAGELGDHDSVALAHLLFGALTEGALLIARADDAATARASVEREVRRLLDGLGRRAR